MSTFASALDGAGRAPVRPGVGAVLTAAIKDGLTRFFRQLPEYFEHVDQIDIRHPPVPY